MIVYISGGCKNGKSSYAEKIANNLREENKPFYYIATMISSDKEDEERIKRHIYQRKNFNFETVEIYKDIKNIEKVCNLEGTFLIDSTTALLANEMFLNNKQFIPNIYKKVAKDLIYIIKKMKNVVIVSDYIFSDSINYDEYTNQYRKGLAFIDKCCAAESDILIEVCYGNIIFYKGKEKLKDIKLC